MADVRLGLEKLRKTLDRLDLPEDTRYISEFQAYYRVEEYKYKWKCDKCGRKNETTDGRETYCKFCHAYFNPQEKMGTITAKR